MLTQHDTFRHTGRTRGVYQKLYGMEFTEADTERITSPIGLSIKAETPAEIAISIAGQMIMHRALRNQQKE